MCNCNAEIDASLAPHNTRLAFAFSMSGRTNLMIQTEQIESGRGKKKALLAVPSYCPFCGEDYAAQEPTSSPVGAANSSLIAETSEPKVVEHG